MWVSSPIPHTHSLCLLESWCSVIGVYSMSGHDQQWWRTNKEELEVLFTDPPWCLSPIRPRMAAYLGHGVADKGRLTLSAAASQLATIRWEIIMGQSALMEDWWFLKSCLRPFITLSFINYFWTLFALTIMSCLTFSLIAVFYCSPKVLWIPFISLPPKRD